RRRCQRPSSKRSSVARGIGCVHRSPPSSPPIAIIFATRLEISSPRACDKPACVAPRSSEFPVGCTRSVLSRRWLAATPLRAEATVARSHRCRNSPKTCHSTWCCVTAPFPPKHGPAREASPHPDVRGAPRAPRGDCVRARRRERRSREGAVAVRRRHRTPPQCRRRAAVRGSDDAAPRRARRRNVRRRRRRVGRMIDWSADRAPVDRALVEACDGLATRLSPRLFDAVKYSLVGAGKRFRALLLLSSYRAVGGSADASKLAAAVEIVHSYSLVHDDLPCMDNDDVRRGRPTVHRAFDERVATTAGVAMVPFAARTAFSGALDVGLSPSEAAAVAREVMIA